MTWLEADARPQSLADAGSPAAHASSRLAADVRCVLGDAGSPGLLLDVKALVTEEAA